MSAKPKPKAQPIAAGLPQPVEDGSLEALLRRLLALRDFVGGVFLRVAFRPASFQCQLTISRKVAPQRSSRGASTGGYGAMSSFVHEQRWILFAGSHGYWDVDTPQDLCILFTATISAVI